MEKHNVPEDVSEFGKEHNLISEAIITGRKLGAGKEFWAKLAHDKDFFEKILAVTDGLAEICSEHFIDTGVTPSCENIPWVSDGAWKIDKNKKLGKIFIGGKKIKLFLAKEYFKFQTMMDAYQMIDDEPFLNALVIEHFLKYPETIPVTWKKYNIYFFGTAYIDGLENIFVRYLFFDKNEWKTGHSWIGAGWRKNSCIIYLEK